jgi:archaellum component FlaC
MEQPQQVNKALAEIYESLNEMNDKINRIFTTLAGDTDLLSKGMVHRVDDLEKNVGELRQFKTKVNAIIITAATIGSVIGSLLSTILK